MFFLSLILNIYILFTGIWIVPYFFLDNWTHLECCYPTYFDQPILHSFPEFIVFKEFRNILYNKIYTETDKWYSKTKKNTSF